MQNLDGASPFLLLGDHAGRAIPAVLGDLGLTSADLDRHIAYDIGVCGLGEALSRRLGAAFISQRYSRLVIDCNRSFTDPASIAQVSDGVPIPGNAALSRAQTEARAQAIFHPYHRRIAGEIDLRQERRRLTPAPPTILVALHSFTPAPNGGPQRPWRYGVLHRNDSPFSAAVLAALVDGHGSEVVGDNRPYAMDGTDFTIPAHADPRRLDYLELEVRQDTIDTPAGQAAAAADLVAVMIQALETAAP